MQRKKINRSFGKIFSIIIIIIAIAQLVLAQTNCAFIDSDDGSFTTTIAVGDLDGQDGPDIVAGNYNYPYMEDCSSIDDLEDLGAITEYQSSITIYWNDGSGNYSFNDVTVLNNISGGVNCIDLGDYDKDGDLDILVGCTVTLTSSLGSGISFIYENVSGVFQITGDWIQSYPYYDTHQIKFVDFDCDGDLDVATLEWQGNLRIYENEIIYQLPESGGPIIQSVSISSTPYEYILKDRPRPNYNNFSMCTSCHSSGGGGGGGGTPPIAWQNYNYDTWGTQMEWCDIDADGDLDVYIDNDKVPTIFKNLFGEVNDKSQYFQKAYKYTTASNDYDLKNVGAASFGRFEFGGTIKKTLAIGSRDFRNNDAQTFNSQWQPINNYTSRRGLSLFQLENGNLVCVNKEDDHTFDQWDPDWESYQSITDVGWAFFNDDGYQDVIAISFPAFFKNSTQYDLNRGNTVLYKTGSGTVTREVLDSDAQTQSISIAFGDWDEANLNSSSQTIDVRNQTRNRFLVHLSYFPISSITSVALYYGGGNWVQAFPTEYTYDLVNGWLSIDPDLVPANPTHIQVNYYYSTKPDFVLGNKEKNIVYNNHTPNPNYNFVSTVDDHAPLYLQIDNIGIQHDPNYQSTPEIAIDAERPVGVGIDDTVQANYSITNYPDLDLWFIQINWGDEIFPGHGFWGVTDKVMKIARDNNIKVILRPQGSPIWAAGGYEELQGTAHPQKYMCRPQDEQFRAYYTRNIVNRYRPSGWFSGTTWGVQDYQIENEPETTSEPGYGPEGSTAHISANTEALHKLMYYNYEMIQKIADLVNTGNRYTVISPNFNSLYRACQINGVQYELGEVLYGEDPNFPTTPAYRAPLKFYCDEIAYQLYCSLPWLPGWQFDGIDPLEAIYSTPSYYHDVDDPIEPEPWSFFGSIKLLNDLYEDYERDAYGNYSNKVFTSIEGGVAADDPPTWEISQAALLFTEFPPNNDYGDFYAAFNNNIHFRRMTMNPLYMVRNTPGLNVGKHATALNAFAKLIKNGTYDALKFSTISIQDADPPPSISTPGLYMNLIRDIWNGDNGDMGVLNSIFSNRNGSTMHVHLIRTKSDPRDTDYYLTPSNSGLTSGIDRIPIYDMGGFSADRTVTTIPGTPDIAIQFEENEIDSSLYMVQEIVGNTSYHQKIQLHKDWNLVSINLLPTNINLTSLMNWAETGEDIYVQDYTQEIWPTSQVLTQWNTNQSFKINIAEQFLRQHNIDSDWTISSATRVSSTGNITINTYQVSANCYEFWISYKPHRTLRLDNYSTDPQQSIFGSLIQYNSPHLTEIQDDEGNSYSITYRSPTEIIAIDDIEFLQQGRGYILKFDANYSGTFNYPNVPEVNSLPGGNGLGEGSSILSYENESDDLASHFYYKKYTGNYYTIVVDTLELGEAEPEIGDEIGVFNSAGLCVGGKFFEGDTPFNMISCADDPMTEEIDGYIQGETIYFRYWDKSERLELEMPGSHTIQSVPMIEEDPSTPRYKGFGEGVYAKKSLNFGNAEATYIPDKFLLNNNYPNPFNPSTIISYNLPEISKVKIEIYNVLGRKVAILIDGFQCAGVQKIEWNTNSFNLSSGIYFCRMTAFGKQTGKNYNSTIKMMLLK